MLCSSVTVVWIVVGEDRSQLAGEEYVSPYIGQQHSGKLADSFLELGKTELDLDIPKHYSEGVPNVGEAQGKFAADKLIEPKYRAENFDNVQPEDYHVNDSPVDLDAESYNSSIDQELQQIWQGTADDSSSFVEKKEKAEIGKSSISYRNVEAAQLAFYGWKQSGCSRFLHIIHHPLHIMTHYSPIYSQGSNQYAIFPLCDITVHYVLTKRLCCC